MKLRWGVKPTIKDNPVKTDFSNMREQLEKKKRKQLKTKAILGSASEVTSPIRKEKTHSKKVETNLPKKDKEFNPFKDDYINTVYKIIRKDRRTIKDSHWLRPDNN